MRIRGKNNIRRGIGGYVGLKGGKNQSLNLQCRQLSSIVSLKTQNTVCYTVDKF